MLARFALLAALATLFLPPTQASAHEYAFGTLKIVHPWSRATPKGATVGGGYMTLVNSGETADRLVSIASPQARKVELHEMAMEGGVMKMRELGGGIPVPPNETVTLAPGGLHVMFVGLAKPLRKGETLPATLIFEKAGSIDVIFKIEALGTSGGGHKRH